MQTIARYLITSSYTFMVRFCSCSLCVSVDKKWINWMWLKFRKSMHLLLKKISAFWFFEVSQVQDWNCLIGPLIDKMFAEPSNAIIVRFLSYISEHLGEAGDVVIYHVLLHIKGQDEWVKSFLSKFNCNILHLFFFCCLIPIFISYWFVCLFEFIKLISKLLLVESLYLNIIVNWVAQMLPKGSCVCIAYIRI